VLCLWRDLRAIFRIRSLVVKQYIGLPTKLGCEAIHRVAHDLILPCCSNNVHKIFPISPNIQELKRGMGGGLWTLRSIIIALWSDKSRGRKIECVAGQVERKDGLQNIQSSFFRMVYLHY
jgi:hypothetical protein